MLKGDDLLQDSVSIEKTLELPCEGTLALLTGVTTQNLEVCLRRRCHCHWT